jgi:chromate transporter
MIQLFLKFVMMGFFSFGGGYAFLSIMEHELVDKTHWLTYDELILALTAGQATPGPVAVAGSFAAFLIGYKINHSLAQGFLYAFMAWVGTNVASILGMGLMMRCYKNIAGHPAVAFTMGIVMPCVIGLIFYLSLKIGGEGLASPPQLLIGLAAFALALFTRVDYVFMILLGGAAGYFFLR